MKEAVGGLGDAVRAAGGAGPPIRGSAWDMPLLIVGRDEPEPDATGADELRPVAGF